MTEVFDKLRVLQEILTQKNKLETEILDAPQSLMTQEKLVERLKENYIEKNKKHEIVRKKINDLKLELHETENIRESAESGMDTIETQREYESLEKQIQDAKKKEIDIRKQLQAEQAESKRLNEEIEHDENLIRQNEEDREKQQKYLESTLDEKKKELERLEVEEKNVSPGLDSETLFKFERIIKSKQGVGIVSVQGNVCNGCHMILPAQFANEVRSGNRLVYCPYCSRILYYQDTSDGDVLQESFFDDSDIGGLTDLDNIDNEITKIINTEEKE